VTATSPEGQSASMPIGDFLARVAPRHMDTGDTILPDGVKTVLSKGRITVWIYEQAPALTNCRWIAADSPAPYGPGATYRTVRLALPYVIIAAVFATDARGQMRLTGDNECFFRTAPLKSLNDLLCYPGLLNCSRYVPAEGHPLSWICTQHLKPSPGMRDPDLNVRVRASFEALRHCLFETGFNYSSEHHEFSSWFSESRSIDPRLQTVEAWEAASNQDPLFPLEVPWLPTQHTVRELVERVFQRLQAGAAASPTAGGLARLVFNHQSKPNQP